MLKNILRQVVSEWNKGVKCSCSLSLLIDFFTKKVQFS